MFLKYCKGCNRELSKESFSKGCSNCKDCEKKRLSEYYKNNKERIILKRKSNYENPTKKYIKKLENRIEFLENYIQRRLKSEQV